MKLFRSGPSSILPANTPLTHGIDLRLKTSLEKCAELVDLQERKATQAKQSAQATRPLSAGELLLARNVGLIPSPPPNMDELLEMLAVQSPTLHNVML